MKCRPASTNECLIHAFSEKLKDVKTVDDLFPPDIGDRALSVPRGPGPYDIGRQAIALACLNEHSLDTQSIHRVPGVLFASVTSVELCGVSGS